MTKAEQLLEVMNEGGYVKNFIDQYIETMLWASTDEEGINLDKNYDSSDLAEETLKKIEKECKEFIDKAEELIDNEENGDYSLAGHDFFLTRNHHGAGFLDGDWEKGKELAQISHSFGESQPYVGDDGQIYIM